MSEKQNDIKYTAADFERYHHGEMPADQMHAIEKAALEDPFLQDALDGYAMAENSAANLKAIEAQLFMQETAGLSKKIYAFPGGRSAFLRAAAIIAFIAGTAYFIFLQTRNEQSGEIKLAQNPVQNPTTTDSNKRERPSVSEIEVATGSETASSNQTNVSPQKQNVTVKKPQLTVQAKTQKEIVKDHSDEISAAKKAVETNPIPVLIAEGKVVNNQGEPIPFASLEVAQQKVNTDMEGNFSMYLKDSVQLTNIAAVGYQPEYKKLKANQSQTIVLNNSISSNDQALNSKAMQKRNGNYTISISVLEPVLGWAHYTQYIKDSLRTILVSDTVEVKLQFQVNAEGQPIQIQVQNVLCIPCNAEAIRVLQNGPKWKYEASKTGVLTIQFFD